MTKEMGDSTDPNSAPFECVVDAISHLAQEQKSLVKGPYDLAVMHVANRMFRFIDVGGIHAHEGSLDRPSTSALQAPVGAKMTLVDFDPEDKTPKFRIGT